MPIRHKTDIPPKMHSVKKAAHRQAWYNSSSEDKSYNLWGRGDAAPKHAHHEPLVARAATENDALSPVEDSRRRDFETANGNHGPHKAGTFPSGPSRDMPPSRAGTGEGVSDSSQTRDIDTADSSKPETENEQDGIVDAPVGSSQSTDAAGPRKRRMRKFMPWKRDPQPPADIERAETTDSKKTQRPQLTFMSQFKSVFASWINVLLIFVPIGIAVEYSGVSKVVVFVMNFIAIIPLAAMLSYATEELALYIGETLGGLLNATFGNAVELIISIIALVQGQILIVQTSLIGSMLSNLLLVLGMSFFFGGLKRKEQFFNVTVAQTAASLLALAIGSLVIPTAFRIFSTREQSAAPLSRGTAILLLITYGCYLLFQLRTHADMYNEPSQAGTMRASHVEKERGETRRSIATIGVGTGAAAAGGEIHRSTFMPESDPPNPDAEEADDAEVPHLTRWGAVATLAFSTALVALCAEYLVSSIHSLTDSVSPEFIGLILLPIVGNAAEHATAVTVAIKDKMDLSIGVAVGSSLQIALLVLPLMVMLNWFGVGDAKADRPMTLDFDGFQVVVLFIAIVVVNYLIQDGKSHWLEGVLLQITYLIIAIAAWFYPADENLSG